MTVGIMSVQRGWISLCIQGCTDDIRVVARSLVHLIGRCSLPVGASHILPSFAGIAEVLPLFLSFCVSVSRHREGRPDTSSVR